MGARYASASIGGRNLANIATNADAAGGRVMHGSNERAVAEMKKTRKWLDRRSFWKWAIPLVLGLAVLVILNVSGAVRSIRLAGGIYALVIVVSAIALVRLVLIVLLAMALARRFRDIGWPTWIGPTILLVTQLGLPFLVATMTYAYYMSGAYDIGEWRPMIGAIADSVSLLLLIVAGLMPGKIARAEKIQVAQVFE